MLDTIFGLPLHPLIVHATVVVVPTTAFLVALAAIYPRFRAWIGPVPALGIAWLIHRTLQIPQTMAATGLFYVAILFVMVGEMLGRLVLYQTGLPL